MPHSRIYLDHNASAPLVPEARARMRAWLDDAGPGNASSTHTEGRGARQIVSAARISVARALGVPERTAERCIVLCGGATEANALVVASAGGTLVTTAIEHPSVLQPAKARGARFVPVDAGGRVELPALREALQGASLCSVILANNETGVLQDVASIADLCAGAGVRLHLDASQAFGRISLSVDSLRCDYLTVSSHKVGGPHGAGALYVRSGAPVLPLFQGGHQERGRRAGTENILAITGFGAAVEAIPARLDAMAEVERLREKLWHGMAGLSDVSRMGQGRCLANTLSVRFHGLSAEGLVMALDLAGVAVSTGSACSSGSVEPSHVLIAMGLSEAQAREVVRFSAGPETTAAEIELALSRIGDVVARARREAA